MNATDEKINWGKVILPALIGSLVTFALTAVFPLFTAEQAKLEIAPSIFADGEYITPVSISNFERTKSVAFELTLPSDNTITEVISNEKNYIDQNSNTVSLQKFPSNSSNSFIIISSKEVEADKVYINTDNKIAVAYVSQNKSPAEENLYSILMPTIIYLIMFLVFGYATAKDNLRYYLKQKEERAELHKKMDENTERLENAKEHSLKAEKQAAKVERVLRDTVTKIKHVYIKRLAHYKKELDFWKDTIRKVMYSSEKDSDASDELFDIVTKSLKTFETKKSISEGMRATNEFHDVDAQE